VSFPGGVDYQGAIQSPRISLAEPMLQACRADLDRQGMPLSWAGSYAMVFRVRDGQGRAWALRCFTQKVEALEARYRAYAAFYAKAPPGLKAALVPARYAAEGIRLAERPGSPWWPVILMAWAEGATLGSWVEQNRRDPGALRRLQAWLAELAEAMGSAGFAHGDLQHRNILVGDRGPILVDYDSVTVPDAPGLPATSGGLPGFRHPGGGVATPIQAHDRFAFLVLHVGLEALVQAPGLYDRWGRVEGLLFQGADFRNCEGSPLFRQLRAEPGLAPLARALESVCAGAAEQAPTLKTFLAAACGTGHPLLRPAWNASSLDRLDGLCNPRAPVLASAAAMPAAPAPGAGAAAAGAAPRSRAGRNRVLAALLLAAALGLGVPALRRHPPVATVRMALVRRDLGRFLDLRKKSLTPMIVQLDEDLEQMRSVPEEVLMAVPEPGGGEASLTAGQVRQRLAETREEARKSLVRCDELREAFDQAVAGPGLTAAQMETRLEAIPDLPSVFRARIRKELGQGSGP